MLNYILKKLLHKLYLCLLLINMMIILICYINKLLNQSLPTLTTYCPQRHVRKLLSWLSGTVLLSASVTVGCGAALWTVPTVPGARFSANSDFNRTYTKEAELKRSCPEHPALASQHKQQWRRQQ